MQFNVIFSDEADDTFESIGQQIANRWGEKEKKEFRRRAYRVTEMISRFPLIFQVVYKQQNIRKAFIHKNCSMFYEIRGSNIAILFFWDNRQDPIFL
jgi:plasmid stabilization system protein ParE